MKEKISEDFLIFYFLRNKAYVHAKCLNQFSALLLSN